MRFTIVMLGMAGARADITDDAWARYYNAFRQQIGGDPNGMTFFTTPRAFGSTYATTGAYEEYDLCNSAPSWQPAYKPAPNSIYDSYKDMVDSLDFEANKQALDKIYAQQKVVDNAYAGWSTCVAGLTAAWLNFHQSQSGLPPADQTTYKEWFDTMGSFACDTAKQAWESQRIQYQDLVDAATHSGYEYVKDAWNKLADPNGYTAVFNGRNTLNVSSCGFSPSGLTTINDWQNGQGTPGSFTVTSKTATESDWTFQAEGGSAFFFDPFAFEAGGKYSRVAIDTSSSDFSMTVSWEGMQTFSMERGSWWDGEIIAGHKEGPFAEGTPIAKGEVQLWGNGGILGLIPAQAVVMYQPTIEITMEEQTYTSVKTSWTSESVTCIFIFCFEQESQGGSTKTKFNDKTFSFTVTDTSIVPKIIAILNDVEYPPGKNSAAASRPATVQVTASNLRSHGTQGLSLNIRPHSVSFEGNGAPFYGKIHISSTPEVQAATTCNEQGDYPNLSAAKVQCIIGKGLKQSTTAAGTVLLYASTKGKDLAHLNMGNTANLGAGAHLTCRMSFPDSDGHHTPLNKAALTWWKGGCCTGSGWPSYVNSDMQKIINTVYSCL